MRFPQRILLIFLFFLLLPGQALAQEEVQSDSEVEGTVNRYVDDIGLDELSKHWNLIVEEYGNYLPESKKGTIIDYVKGEHVFSVKEWFKGIIAFFIQEITINLNLLGQLMLLTIFSVFLRSLHQSFEQGTVSKVAYAVIFMVLIIITLNSFRVASEYAIHAIDQMSQFIISLLPLLLALIASSGGVTSAGFFHPVLVFLVNISSLMIKNGVLPLLFLSTMLSIANTLNYELKVSQLADLLKKASVGILGVFMTILLGVMTIQGTATAVTDGIAIRTAKFVTGNFIPVVGRMFTDAADTVLSASVLLKNTIGIAGVVIIFLLAAFPAIKILVISFIYKLTSALLQPVGDGPVISCLNAVSHSLLYIFASLAIVSFMFFISLTIIITSGNITMMIR